MSSPFPGMDPYLEAPDLWEDFHANLASEIQAQLAPRLRPRYYAALTPRVTYEEVVIGATQAVKPDVSIWKVDDQPHTVAPVAIAPAPLIGRTTLEVAVKEQRIEIREAQSGDLVTAIEILSPFNKRPGHEAFDKYQRKRRLLLRTAVHLLEIDFLRRGLRLPVTPLPDAPYFVFLSRSEERPRVEIWPIQLPELIPVVPVPLLEPDADVPLDLGRAVHDLYERTAYDLRIDYSQPPPKPDLLPEEAEWVEALLLPWRER
ncbi:MAG: DUF4058 family protein [Chloroflexota bacterium]